MPDSTPATPTNPMPTANAAGGVTSELWFHVAAGVAIAVLTALQAHSDALPPLAKAAVEMVAPLAIAWLAKSYGDTRSTIKAAALSAGATAAASVTSAATAAALLRSGP